MSELAPMKAPREQNEPRTPSGAPYQPPEELDKPKVVDKPASGTGYPTPIDGSAPTG